MVQMSYGAILIDPPWSFKTYSGKRTIAHRCVQDPYEVMTHQELESLPVPDLAAKNCAVFLWVVDSHLDRGIDLIRHWNFTYKTIAFVWSKTQKNGQPRMGMGYWTRKSAEICLLATRGKVPRKSKGVRQFHQEPRREHSRKPDEFYGRIEALVDGPYLEMFARQNWPKWDVWGDETEKFARAS